MPELPEVQTVVNSLTPRISGAVIRAVDLRRRDIVTPDGIDLRAKLTGRRIESIDRRGKRIVFSLDDGNRFYIHLGMSGRLMLESPDAEILKHTHLLIDFESPDVQMRFRDARRFGGVWWLGSGCRLMRRWGTFEPLEVTAEQLCVSKAEAERGGQSKSAAAGSECCLRGLGNIYADEALHAAGIRPTRHADRSESR